MGTIEILQDKYRAIWDLIASPDIFNVVLGFQLANSQHIPLKQILEPLKFFMAAIYQYGKVTKKTLAKQAIKPNTVHEVLQLSSIYIDLKGKIQEIPKEVNLLTKLQQLQIQGRVKSLPTIIPDMLSRLHTVQLTRNELRQLPEGLSSCPLMLLDVEGNYLRELPSLPSSLVSLNISRNIITKVPEDRLGYLTRLQRLHIGDNPIRRLPNCFSNLLNLDTLAVNDTLLSRLPDSLLECAQLTNIYTNNTILNYKETKKLVPYDCIIHHHSLI